MREFVDAQSASVAALWRKPACLSSLILGLVGGEGIGGGDVGDDERAGEHGRVAGEPHDPARSAGDLG